MNSKEYEKLCNLIQFMGFMILANVTTSAFFSVAFGIVATVNGGIWIYRDIKGK